MKPDPLILFSAHLDGYELTPIESRQLSRWVNADPRHAQQLVRLAYIHESLDTRMCVPEMLGDLANAEDEELRLEISKTLDTFWQSFEDTSPPKTLSSPSSHTRKVVAGVTASVVAALLLGMIVLPLTKSGNEPKQQAAAQGAREEPTPPAIPQVVSPPPVSRKAQLVGSVEAVLDASWSRESPLDIGAPVLLNEVINVEQGVVQIRTNVGHTVVVEGPSRVQFRSPQQFSVHSGRVVGRVGELSGSLDCETPGARIMDLGTEFGVSVNADKSTDVSVYDGAIEVRPLKGPSASALTVASGLRASVDQQGKSVSAPKRQVHDRAFVRPDEVKLRLEAAAGSQRSAAVAAYYQLLRSELALAYQGFDAKSRGTELSIGFSSPALRTTSGTSSAPDLRKEWADAASSLVVPPGGYAWLDLDTRAASRLTLAGYVNDQGLVGKSGKQLWIACTMRSRAAPAKSEVHAGMSLTTADYADEQDLFFGRIHRAFSVGVQVNKGPGGQDGARIKHPLDSDKSTAGRQATDADANPHTWVARIRFRNASDDIAVWYDTSPKEVEQREANLTQSVDQIAFDRIRFSLGDDGVFPSWEFDEVVLAASLEELVLVVETIGTRELARNGAGR